MGKSKFITKKIKKPKPPEPIKYVRSFYIRPFGLVSLSKNFENYHLTYRCFCSKCGQIYTNHTLVPIFMHETIRMMADLTDSIENFEQMNADAEEIEETKK